LTGGRFVEKRALPTSASLSTLASRPLLFLISPELSDRKSMGFTPIAFWDLLHPMSAYLIGRRMKGDLSSPLRTPISSPWRINAQDIVILG